MNLTTGNLIVDQMKDLNITGNIIPMSWFKTFSAPRKTDKKNGFSGKIKLLAINILADIVYWYRPVEVRDEKTGFVIGYKKKFKSDLLQKNYDDLGQMFMCSKKDAQRAVAFLESFGVIKRVFKNIKINSLTLANVLFLELNIDALKKMTYPKKDDNIDNECDNVNELENNEVGDTSSQYCPDPLPISSRHQYDIVQTNTENTTKITSKNTYYEEKIEKEKPEVSKKANHKKEETEKNAPTSQEIVDAYNETCVSLPRVAKITDKRKRALKKISSKFSMEDIRTVFKKAQESSFLNGSTDKWSGATFDWLVKEDNVVKVLEGKYDDKNVKRKNRPHQSYNLDEFQNYSIFDDE